MHTAISTDDARCFVRFWDFLEAHQAEINAAVAEAVRRIPAFAALVDAMTPEVREALEQRIREKRRAALVEGRWEPYLEALRAQGRQYAQIGVDFRDWVDLPGAFRGVVFARLLGDAAESREHAADILAGMDRFIDISLGTIGQSYLETKATLIRRAESQAALYSDMFRGAPVGMLVYHWDQPPDPGSFRILDMNPAASRISTRLSADFVGRTLREVFPQYIESDAVTNFVAAVETGQSREWTSTVPNAQGSATTFHTYCFAPKEHLLGVIFEDITERRQMEQKLQSYVADLERSNRDLDEFAYVASHDLKSPLQDIRNLATWITEDLGEGIPAASVRHLTLLRDRAGRMERLLDDLLAYSRAGRVAVTAEDVSFQAVLDEALALVHLPEGFRVEVEGGEARLLTPRAPLAQVLRNLIGNAIKHHDRPAGSVRVAAAAADGELRVAVTDDGPGIPAEFHERVFRMFQTLRPRDQVEGSGMGLAIVKKVIEHHGGSVSVESAGRGTTVHFTWPRRWAGRARDAQ